MKKHLGLLALMVTLSAILLSGCAENKAPNASTSAEKPAAPAVEENKTEASEKAVAAQASQAAASDTTQTASSADPVFKILPGDILQITVWKEDGLDREVLVLPEGSITFPLIGTVMAQGHSTADIQDIIKKKLKKLIPDASVSVSVKAALGHTVNVIGQVNKPGEIVMSGHLTVMQALSQAGGLTPYARERRVMVLRRTDGTETSIPVPYSSIVGGDDLNQDISLQPGDVVVVPTAGFFF